MEKIGIFGKKNSVVKYNLDTHESLWVADLPNGQTPKAIAQYEDFLLVIHQNWAGTKNISCFSESSGNLLWRYRYDFLCGWNIYFQPIFVGKNLIFKKRFLSFEKFEIIYVGKTLIAFSEKEIRKIDIESGDSALDEELTKKFNVKGVTAYLGNGVSFVSSISSLNQQLEDEATAASSTVTHG